MKVAILLAVFAAATAQNKFPAGFKFGAATSAIQVEGGWNADGKTENIWDHGYHTNPNLTPDKHNADVACDSYHKWKEDVQMVKALGVDFYRFSISWPRILPNGHANNVNQKGIDYYNNLINELLKNGIQPYVTIYHWDLPQILQNEVGGWTDRRMINLFVDYARVLFQHFGDRVKWWMTFNEIIQICERGYADGAHAPFVHKPGVGGYECAHTIILAHSRVYRMYEKEFKAKQNGKIGYVLNTYWHEPNKPVDKDASDFSMLMAFGWFAHPLVFGHYPDRMIDRIKGLSFGEDKLKKSRLPEFTAEEKAVVHGAYDFIGLNHYQTDKVYFAGKPVGGRPSHQRDTNVIGYKEADWWRGVPWGFRKLLVWIKNIYKNPPILVCENGHAGEHLEDHERVTYLRGYLDELAKAIDEDKCNVIGYTVWSLMDNFEWRGGFTIRMGLFFVDFNDPNRKRTPKYSSFVYNHIIKTRHVDYNYKPKWPPALEWAPGVNYTEYGFME